MLEFSQSRVREVERDGDSGDPIRREPFAGQPHMRLVPNPAALELFVEVFGPIGQRRAMRLMVSFHN